MKVTQTVKLDSHGLALTLVPRRNCLRVVMRITPEGARFSVPYGIDFESLEPIVRKMLTEHAEKLRLAPLYTRGQIIETSFGSIAITSGAGGRGLRLRETQAGFEICVSPALDIASRPGILAIANGLKQIGTLIVRRHILDEARKIAIETGAGMPDSWTVGHGRSTFGTCRRRGTATEISLSYTMAFLPSDLRRYIVCHELAHLREMNHSPRFHALCNAYCSGLEAELSRRLRHHPLPLP